MSVDEVLVFASERINISSESDTISTSLSEISSISSDDFILNDSEDENDLYFPLMHYLTTGRKRNKVEQYNNVVESWTDVEFKEHFRLSRTTTFQLIDDLKMSGFILHHRFGMKPITAKLSFYIFLWFMANTEPLRTIADRFNISISSTFRVVRRVLAWILTKMDNVIKWPQAHNYVCADFYSKKGIPNVVGAIDCTHIRIEKPSHNERDYCNRKKYFSILLQATVDSNLRFTNIYCGEPGSLHDARVLRRSPLYNAAIDNKDSLFPNNTFILGDSAYPSLSWLVPPFRDNGRLTPQQAEFNFIHSSTRMAVEKAFGLLKGRFRRIKFFSEYRNIEFITNTVVAACILHNYCLNENDNFEYMDCENDNIFIDEQQQPVDVHVENNIEVDRRLTLFRELFPETM